MSRLAWVLLCGGCELAFPLRDPDARISDTPDASLGAACSEDPLLMACYDFEGDVRDGSIRGNHLISTGAAPVFVPGRTGMGIQMLPTMQLDVGNPELDGEELTIETWLTYVPAEGDQLVIDHETKWALGLAETGAVKCFLASGADVSTEEPDIGLTIKPGVFTHVACTQRPDPGNNDAIVEIFINGLSVGTKQRQFFGMTPTATVGVGANSPGATDKHFVGQLDRLRIWNRVLPPDEIAAAAGVAPP